MQMKSLVSTIKNIFQDAVIHIPYFASVLESTSTLGISIQEGDKQYSQVMDLLQKQIGIVAQQSKLYYDKDTCYKTVIIQFQTVDLAKKFYQKYAKNPDKLLFQFSDTSMQEQNKYKGSKYSTSFCKDISRNGINMEEILYILGKVSVIPPESIELRDIIKQVAKLITVEGIRGEQQLLKCRDLVLLPYSTCLLDFMDPKFLSSEAIYYRWRVYSYLQGDGDKNYRTEPFQMTIGGPFYHPPQDYCQKFLYRVLNFEQRQYITKLLETMSTKKFNIEQAMSFCINNSNSAIQISSIIAVSIIDSCSTLSASSEEQNKLHRHTTIKHLIALFYLISDIFFNSPTTIYRDIFIALLPAVMQRLPSINQLNSKIKQIVQIWNRKFIFEEEFLRGLTLLINRQLPSMQPLGMEQMTRTQHQCYKELLKIETTQDIQAMCWKYGLVFSSQKLAECLRNLSAVLAMEKRKEAADKIQPEIGPHDGEPLTDKDLQKIKTKACRIISCQDVPVRLLFEKDKNSKSISYD